NLLFACGPKEIWVFDLTDNPNAPTHPAEETFTDMSLAPDQSALFAADFGGQAPGSRTALKPSRIHRFDLAARKWEKQTAPKAAFRCKAVDADRILLIEKDFAVDITLNKWEPQ